MHSLLVFHAALYNMLAKSSMRAGVCVPLAWHSEPLTHSNVPPQPDASSGCVLAAIMGAAELFVGRTCRLSA
jgi:hypothetical protein